MWKKTVEDKPESNKFCTSKPVTAENKKPYNNLSFGTVDFNTL